MILGNVNKRFHNLIGHLRQVNVHVSPVPTSHNEMRHLHDSFRTLGTLELFQVHNTTNFSGLYGHDILLTYNIGSDTSVLDPATELSEQLTESSAVTSTAKQREQHLIDSLNRIIALPRCGYVSEFEGFNSGDIEIPFTYKIPQSNRADLIGKFELSASTLLFPFCSITNDTITLKDVQAFRRIIRYNMTKFHKFNFTPLRKVKAEDIGRPLTESFNPTRKLPTGFYS